MPNHKIMIVEDEKIVAADIQASVEKMGYSVCASASSGLEAITKAESTRPDLILMDIMLKGSMDGIEAATRIKELCNIPVVYLTAFGDDSMVRKAKVAEPYGYITKPFRYRELQIAIEISIYKKQAEARIEKMERWLATVLKSVGDAVIASDKEHRITFMNAVAEKLTGWNQHDALGKKLTEVLSIKDQDLHDLEKHLVEKVMTEGLIINLIEDRLLIAKNGAEVPISDSVAPIKEDNGETPGTVLVFRDITENKRAAEELRTHQVELEMQNEDLRRTQMELDASHARYFDLYDLAPVGYLTLSEKGLILEANLTAATLMGVPRNALGKRLLGDFILPEDQNIYFGHRKQLFETCKPQTWEMRMVKQDGVVFWVHLEGIAAQDTDGAPECRITMSDINKYKQAEAEQARLEDHLQQAQKMESVGRLAGGVAHDFNNMLGVIIGHTEIALEHVAPSNPLHADLMEIYKAAYRSADLTRQLLAFARKQVVSPKVLDLNETVEGMLKMLRRLIGEDIKLSWLPGSNLWPVKVDPAQLDQILANLCVNARDAISDVGKISIETRNDTFDKDYCTLQAGFVPGEYVLLVVSDAGCGMDKETLSHLFEPFFTTKEIGKGTGLGLATVYGIIKQNNGFIDVCSELGQGTTFKIYLPRYVGKAEPPRTIGLSEAASRGHETILLVEDELTILEMTTKILEMQGYTVLVASTTSEAIRLAKEHAGEIHLLMTDVVMPEMNGRDLAKNLLALCPNLKQLFTSGYTADIIAHHGVLDEGVHFIQKPFSIKRLAAKVREVLDQKL